MSIALREGVTRITILYVFGGGLMGTISNR